MTDAVTSFAEAAGHALELAGVGVVIVGAVWSVVVTGRSALRPRPAGEGRVGLYWTFRSTFARAILLGLEILIAADIVITVTVDLTVESALALGLIVLVRIALSWSLSVEVDGRWPWQTSPGATPDEPVRPD
jgi:uncharacterized membrane protein